MALFDYKCGKCERITEDIIETWDAVPAPRDCPHCKEKGSAIRIDFYQTWFSYTGMGWNHTRANCSNYKV